MGGGGGSKKILVGLVVLMLFGVAVYLKLWTIDYTVSSDEAELLRRQFDLANREAMDESAEWRLKYDVEAERATKCMNELKQENMALVERMEAMKQELEAEKLKCSLQ
ncbi:hypothetical protein PRUPE_6G236600 [Prunus persica]|uniref:Uncharacterized protein n=1 Tax=Prunus persica TaxID=3760 RepID=A0A251NUU0_PRUPE|nr:uncharacterized protein LOC18772765 isoform X2 [Prunus persica]XP_034219826.1 uncharacterized protein LOC117631017 isoform X3 [Prunus dulcis]ONI03072.1 hypothetical protein PRUPE_6G236600 [Prunus persica]